MSTHNTSLKRFLIYLVIGAALGLALGVFLAVKLAPSVPVPSVQSPVESALPTPVVDVAPHNVTSYKEAVNAAAASVVNIQTQAAVPNPYAADPFWGQLFEMQNRSTTNLGSGVIVESDGYIVTNAHVIANADAILVSLHDGRDLPAVVVGVDAQTDLALIRVDAHDLTPIRYRQAPLSVGDVTLAIGNPFGVGQTVTQGIVSGLGRTGLGVSLYEDFVQTDAAINPGNSGGALIDAMGRLIGINTVIYSRTGASVGIGYAIPTQMVQKVVQDLKESGTVNRGYVGINLAPDAIRDAHFGSQTRGALVADVLPSAPAFGHILPGDVIVMLDTQPILGAHELLQSIGMTKAGDVLHLQVMRQGALVDVDIKADTRPVL